MTVGPLVAFRPLAAGDLPLLARWLAEPHVERFYREPSDLPSVRQRYLPAIRGDDPTDLFMIVFAIGGSARDIGMIQRYRIADHPEWVGAFPPSVEAWTGPSASTT
jgi:aminoglycoside 6'-N-acetyltransferase